MSEEQVRGVVTERLTKLLTDNCAPYQFRLHLESFRRSFPFRFQATFYMTTAEHPYPSYTISAEIRVRCIEVNPKKTDIKINGKEFPIRLADINLKRLLDREFRTARSLPFALGAPAASHAQ